MIFEEVAGVMEDAADALERHDEDAARAALARAAAPTIWSIDCVRRSPLHVRRCGSTYTVAGGSPASSASRRPPLRWTISCATCASCPARASASPAARRPPAALIDRHRASLAVAVRSVEQAMAADLSGDEEAAQRHAEPGRGPGAGRPADRSRPARRRAPRLPVVMIVGQLRASAIDLLRAAGSDEIVSLSLVDEALGLPPA